MQPEASARGERTPGAVIDLEGFIRNLQRHLQTPVPEGINSETRLRKLEGWTSLEALVVVASFEWDYGVTISADEFVEAETIHDLYRLVMSRAGN
jgi:acyl carrier protein